MLDHYNRKIDYMRISITDRCNLRCRYCMPEGIQLISMDDILRYEEIVEICRIAAKLGIREFKITGGEPFARKGCASLIRQIKDVPGVEQVTLTTNGILIPEYMEALKQAAPDGINISLDTLDAHRYSQITGFPLLHKVMEGIDLSLKEGWKVKLNCVLQKGINDDEWKNLAELARTRPLDVRFIELMPIGEAKGQEQVSNKWLLRKLYEAFPAMKDDPTVHGNGPAVYYKIPDFQGSIGLISAIHGKFCEQCNRIRMTSTGDIKPCLCYKDSISIREAVRSHDYEMMKAILEEAIIMKPQMHHFEEASEITEHKKMVQIGG